MKTELMHAGPFKHGHLYNFIGKSHSFYPMNPNGLTDIANTINNTQILRECQPPQTINPETGVRSL